MQYQASTSERRHLHYSEISACVLWGLILNLCSFVSVACISNFDQAVIRMFNGLPNDKQAKLLCCFYSNGLLLPKLVKQYILKGCIPKMISDSYVFIS